MMNTAELKSGVPSESAGDMVGKYPTATSRFVETMLDQSKIFDDKRCFYSLLRGVPRAPWSYHNK